MVYDGASPNYFSVKCLESAMVVSIHPWRRRRGLWWRMEARAAGEDIRGDGEYRGNREKMRGREKQGRSGF